MAGVLLSRHREVDAGYKALPIGTQDHPWPRMGRGEDAEGNRTIGLEVIQQVENPLWLRSAREYAEVMPELLRNMPVPGMLDAFEKILKNPLVYLESDPAFGKSYLANLIGNALHPKGAIIYDAGGQNLESLLFETVFDSDASSDLVDRINKALQDGTMTEPSLKALRELKVNNGDESSKSLLSEEGGRKVFDWKGLETSGVDRGKLDSVLNSVQKYQEWGGGLRIGFKDVDGALIRAALEHRPLVIDEFARRKIGSEARLQQIWQVINGEIPEMVIPLGNLGEFTLRHGDIPKVIMTSNKPKDGADVYPISDSLDSRLVKAEIHAFTEEDWAHRISQALTGVPVTTLARLEKGRMEGNETDGMEWKIYDHDKFRRNLESIRNTGVPFVPALHTKLLDHWQEVITVSKALAKAFHQSAQLLDPESTLLKQTDMAQIRMEVDKPGDRASKLTPRTTLRMLRQAIDSMTQSVPATETKGADFTNWDTPQISPSSEPVEAKMGDRLKQLVDQWIDEAAGVTIDGAKRPKLYERLKQVWKNAGILGPNSTLEQLNIGSKKIEPVSEDVQRAKDIIDTLLRAQYPDYEGVTPQAVETFLKGLEANSLRSVAEETVATQVLTTDVTSIQNARFTESITVASRPALENASWADFIKQHPAENLIEQDKLISTLALPYVSKELLRAVSKLPDQTTAPPEASYDASAACVTTTTLARTPGNTYAKLHILHNKTDGHTLVITFSPSAISIPDHSKLTVIHASDFGAQQSVQAWLKQHTTKEAALTDAFGVRNLLQENDPRGLAELLTSSSVKVFSPTIADKTNTASRSA